MHWRLHAVRAGVPKKRRRFSLVRKHRGLLAQFEALESRCLLSGNSGSQIGTIFASKLAAQSHWLSPQFKLLNQGDLAPRVSSSPTGLTPSIIRQAYGFNQVLFDGGIVGDGTGQTIAIVDAYHAPTIKNDLHAFDEAFGLPDPPSFLQVAQDGSTNFPSVDPAGAGAASGTWEVETALDVEWAHALAPGANILLVEANSPSDADLIQAAVGFRAASQTWLRSP